MPGIGGGGGRVTGVGGSGTALPYAGGAGAKLAMALGSHRTPQAHDFNPTPANRRQRMQLLLAECLRERASFDSQWGDIADYIAPRRSRAFLTDNNRGEKTLSRIIDSVATQAVRDLEAGMLSGMASPSRIWFNFVTDDPRDADDEAAREWLEGVRDDVTRVLGNSNFYTTLGSFFGDEACFGTAAFSIVEDADDVIRCYLHPCKSYAISTDDAGRVVTFVREFRMTVRQLVGRFGLDSVTDRVREMFDRGATEQWVDVCHAITPNSDFQYGSRRSARKAFYECYWESCAQTSGHNSNGVQDRMLLESGYDEFPVMVGRWALTGDDIYGTMCPGMLALPDVKMLMEMERHGLNALAAQLKPPLQHPASLGGVEISLIPGDSTEVQSTEGGGQIKPIVDVQPRLDALEVYQARVIDRIEGAFYRPLFRSFINEERAQPPTAEEIRARQREKLSLLGPVLERHDDDVLGPAIERVYAIMLRRGLIPPPPASLANKGFRIQHVSEVALAQRLTGLGGLERYASQMTALSQFVPAILDNCDWDEYSRHIADALGVSPKVTRGEEDRGEVREARAAAEAQAQAAAAVPAAASAVRDLSQSPIDPNTALGQLMARSGA